ncbi:PilW family protein [Thermodesulfobacteriota bacterium]
MEPKMNGRIDHARDMRGFTLLELLVALTLTSFVVVGLYNISVSQIGSFYLQDQLSETQQTVRAALDEISFQVRMAGYIPLDDRDGLGGDDVDHDIPSESFADGANEAFDEASAQRIAIEADVDNDGNTDTVQYALFGTNLYKRKWYWRNATSSWITEHGWQVVAENINSLRFNYIFGDGDSGIPDETDGDTTNDREDIRAVEIVLSVHTEQEYDDLDSGYNKSGSIDDGTCPVRTLRNRVIVQNYTI